VGSILTTSSPGFWDAENMIANRHIKRKRNFRMKLDPISEVEIVMARKNPRINGVIVSSLVKNDFSTSSL